MRCFICSDIHMATDFLDRLLEKARQPIDAILFAGDLTNWGKKSDALKVIHHFNGIPAATIPGNLDTPIVLQTLENETHSVHGLSWECGDWTIIGYGGGALQNPGEILVSEEEIIENLEPLLKKSNPLKTILLTHQPPYNTKLDYLSPGQHVGSKAVRTMIEKYQPAFQFCGHIHESWSEENIDQSRCYNVAAVKEGRAALLTLEEGVFTRLIL